MMKSKYKGFCILCKKSINVGDEIEKDSDSGKWVHTFDFHNDNENPLGIAIPSVPATRYTTSIVQAENTIQVKKFIPSPHQVEIFIAMRKMIEGVPEYKNIIVRALAGTGKSTTLLEGTKYILSDYPDTSIRIIAFNKPIAKDFDEKLQRHLPGKDIKASTFHSLCLENIRRYSPRVKVEKYKVMNILDSVYPVSKQAMEDGLIDERARRENFSKRRSMRDLVSMCKNTLVDVQDGNAVLACIDKYNIEIEDDFISEIVERLPEIMEICKTTDTVDFDDMLWLLLVMDIPVEKYDVVMGDEWQDFSEANLQLIQKFVKPDGHIVGVGDEFQSLYAWRGADSQAIPKAIRTLNAKVLDLPVTRRCPKSHVRINKSLVPNFEALEDAPEGTIENVKSHMLTDMLSAGDMVLCRTNAPLVKPAFECVRKGKKAIIRGMEFAESLIALIKRFETNDLGQFEVMLAEYFQKEYQRFLDKGKEMQASLLEDRVTTLRYIANECETVPELLSRIELLFDDNNRGIVFSSVHRAKGLESERIFIMHPELLPHPRAKGQEELQQEMNCRYVAQTRSKSELYFVEGE